MTKIPKATSSWVSELTWSDIEKRIESGACALLPIGASAKEHGRHLPMNTDFLQAKWLAERLAFKRNLLVWPVVSYGYYPAFVEFPGSVTLSQAAFSLMMKDIVNCILDAAVPGLVLLNTGISTIRPLDQIARESADRLNLINVYSGRYFKAASARVIEQSAGGHADETETSIMLAIEKSLVNMSKASGSLQACAQPGVLSRTDVQSLNYTPSGACGAPQLASSEKGVILLEAMLKDINLQLDESGFSAYCG